MKKMISMIVRMLSIGVLSTTAYAATCDVKFMEDPCPVDGYSIVNTEKFVRSHHNWMHDIHHFDDISSRVKNSTYIKKRYTYTKKCRLVRVER